MSQKNIIITIDWFLPGTNAGGPVRSVANMIEQLHEFNFYIITRNTDYCSSESYKNVEPNTWINFSQNTQVYYFSDQELNKSNLEKVITSIDSKTIYINGIYSSLFSRAPLAIAKKHGLNPIVSTRGMLSPHALAVKSLKKKAFLVVQNAKQHYKGVHFHVTNEEEKKHVQKVIKNYDKITAIPNLPKKLNEEAIDPIQKEKGAVKLIALGRIAEEKGTLVGISALKNINGKVQLDLYGTIYDQEYWKKCQTLIATLPENIAVNYCGELNAENVPVKLKEYHFLLLPSKGENYGHSIVESFCSGRPVIISKNTPWKALEKGRAGFDVEESELTSAIQNAIDMDQPEFNEWSKSALNKGTQIANDPTVIEKYKQLFRSES